MKHSELFEATSHSTDDLLPTINKAHQLHSPVIRTYFIVCQFVPNGGKSLLTNRIVKLHERSVSGWDEGINRRGIKSRNGRLKTAVH